MEVKDLQDEPPHRREGAFLTAERAEKFTPHQASRVVQLWNFQFTASAFWEVKDIAENVCKDVTVTSGKAFQTDKWTKTTNEASPLYQYNII